MTVIVLDASAALWALRAAGQSRRLVRDDDVHAPHLIDCELAQTFRKLEPRTFSAEEAARMLEGWMRYGVSRHSVVGLLPRIWQLRANLTAYDAAYVALAEALDCPLLTADRHLAGAPGVRATVITVTS